MMKIMHSLVTKLARLVFFKSKRADTIATPGEPDRKVADLPPGTLAFMSDDELFSRSYEPIDPTEEPGDEILGVTVDGADTTESPIAPTPASPCIRD